MSEPTTDEVGDEFTFDWRDEDEGFLKWLVPTVIAELAELPGGAECYDELTNLTEAWTSVRLELLVNGRPVPTREFIAGIERTIRVQAARTVVSWLARHGELGKLASAVAEVERAATDRLRELARAAGLDVDAFEDDG